VDRRRTKGGRALQHLELEFLIQATQAALGSLAAANLKHDLPDDKGSDAGREEERECHEAGDLLPRLAILRGALLQFVVHLDRLEGGKGTEGGVIGQQAGEGFLNQKLSRLRFLPRQHQSGGMLVAG